MTRTEIDGVKVVHEFSVLWPGWECDQYGWVTEDGRAWMTTHGSDPYEADASDLLERMDVALGSAEGIRKALTLVVSGREPVEAKNREPAE